MEIEGKSLSLQAPFGCAAYNPPLFVVSLLHAVVSPSLCFTPMDQACSNHWTEGYGMLTELGSQQLYQLGLQLHQRYVQDTSLVRSNYTRRDIYVRSTDVER